MSYIRFASTQLKNCDNSKITPDSDGYYDLIIGALNVYNSAGELYTSQGVVELFNDSSILMRRIKKGCLKGEVGHPPSLGLSKDQYIRRLLTIQESNVCCHFKEIYLDTEFGKRNPGVCEPNTIAIRAKLKPSGPNGSALQKALDNPEENVCFSVRGFTEDYQQRGQLVRYLREIVCWDWVNEPGIHIASKWNTQSLEEFSVTEKMISKIMENDVAMTALESNGEMVTSIHRLFDSHKQQKSPLISNW